MATDREPQGVTSIEHMADVGLEVRAPERAELFERAARGLTWLIEGGDGGGELAAWAFAPRAVETRGIELAGPDLPTLLRAWLRELLHLHEVEGLAFRDARFGVLTDERLRAEVRLAAVAREPIREIKGVTLHGLVAEPRGDAWFASVIFDV